VTTDPIFFNKPVYLLVEGNDEKMLLEYLCKHLQKQDASQWSGIDNIQIEVAGGVTQISEALSALGLASNFSEVRVLGIIRDAENDPDQARTIIQDALRKNRLAVPEESFIPAKGTPHILMLIIPPDKPGMLEDLCLLSIRDSPIMPCIDSFFTCVEENQKTAGDNKNKPNNMKKAKVHAFLSTRPDPQVALGGGAQRGYWDLDSPAFTLLRDFLSQIIVLINNNYKIE